jgi:hypothetical protein
VPASATELPEPVTTRRATPVPYIRTLRPTQRQLSSIAVDLF